VIDDFCISSRAHPAIYPTQLDTLYVQGTDHNYDGLLSVLEFSADVVQKYFMNVVRAVATFNGRTPIPEFQDLKPTGIIE
jgi:hypothetical protein